MAILAQLVEQHIRNVQVTSSSLVDGSRIYRLLCAISRTNAQHSSHNSCGCRTLFDIPGKRALIVAHEQRAARENFWQDRERAARVMRELEETRADVERFDALLAQARDMTELCTVATTDAEWRDIGIHADRLAARVRELTFYTYFSGPYDACPAIVTIVAGAGGADAQDWADMLGRMYLRWAQRKGFPVRILDRVDGAEAGIKSMTVEIDGRLVYGWARAEAGVHRLVRLSPFNADSLRQTSFARVEVLPVVEQSEEISIAPEDLRIDTYRASGAGGQHVNTTDSAVRITHVPTGVQAQCQNERSQKQNKEAALRLLKAKLHQRALEERAQQQQALRGTLTAAAWGNQIRSYVLHPYKLVKDHRTMHETAHVDAVLDGDLEPFMTAYLTMNAAQRVVHDRSGASVV